MLHRLRLAHPEQEIYISKYDLDAAYRRLHMHPDHAVCATTIVENMGYVLTRLAFGAAAGPSVYSSVSEAIFGLSNDLMPDPHWDPRSLTSPNTPTSIPQSPRTHPFLFQKQKT